MANLLKGQPRDQFLEQRTKVGQLVRELQQAVSLSDRTNRCIVEAVANNNMEQFAQLRPNEFADQEKAYVEQAITVKLTGQPTTDMVNTAVEMFLLILGSNTASVDANVRQLMEELIFNQPWGSASRLMCDMLNRVFELHGQYLQNRQADDSVNLNT